MPTLLRDWDVLSAAVFLAFVGSCLMSALVWGYLLRQPQRPPAARTLIRSGAALIIASLLVMAGLPMLLAFTLFSLAAGSLLVALGLVLAMRGFVIASSLFVGVLAFIVGAVGLGTPVELVPVALLAVGFGVATALLSTRVTGTVERPSEPMG